jgi:hypothetical protein
MVKHIIFWDFAEELTAEEKAQSAGEIKAALENLVGVVPGLLELKVYSNLLDSSNADLALYSVLESKEALDGYQVHPAHVKAAVEVVRPRVKNRRCGDFEV